MKSLQTIITHHLSLCIQHAINFVTIHFLQHLITIMPKNPAYGSEKDALVLPTADKLQYST